MDTSLNDLQAWIGRSETVRDHDRRDAGEGADRHAGPPGDRPWRRARRCRRCGTGCTSCRCTGSREIGPDGHAKRGGFLPPVPLPRRMWAGSQFEFRSPLRVGDAVERTSTIDDVTSKDGRTGPLVFVKVRHELRCNGAAEPALVEFHDIVYREAPSARTTSRRRRRPRRPARPGSARSCPTTCCCSATRR